MIEVKHKCECCGIEISQEQWNYCHLCGLCDTGKCRSSKAYHKLQKRYFALMLEVERLTQLTGKFEEKKQ